jgi:septum site-determining protein MinD
VQKALIKDRRLDNLWLLPASQTDDKDAVTPDDMKSLVMELKHSYDFVLIDCPAGIEQGFKNAIAGADEAVVVATPEVSSIRDADRVVGLLAAADVPARLIVNRISPQLVKRGDMLSQADVIEILALELLGGIPLDDQVIATTNKGVPAVLEGKSMAAREFVRIAKLLAGHEVEAKESVGFFTRIGRALGLPSREIAKGRLHLVLAHDRTGLDGGRLQEMREEIAKVIAKYVEINSDAVEIQIETRNRETQLTVSSAIQARNA